MAGRAWGQAHPAKGTNHHDPNGNVTVTRIALRFIAD